MATLVKRGYAHNPLYPDIGTGANELYTTNAQITIITISLSDWNLPRVIVTGRITKQDKN